MGISCSRSQRVHQQEVENLAHPQNVWLFRLPLSICSILFRDWFEYTDLVYLLDVLKVPADNKSLIGISQLSQVLARLKNYVSLEEQQWIHKSLGLTAKYKLILNELNAPSSAHSIFLNWNDRRFTKYHAGFLIASNALEQIVIMHSKNIYEEQSSIEAKHLFEAKHNSCDITIWVNSSVVLEYSHGNPSILFKMQIPLELEILMMLPVLTSLEITWLNDSASVAQFPFCATLRILKVFSM